MQTFISVIHRLQGFSKRLDDLTMLTNQHWVVVDEIDKVKTVYIFRANKELLISCNGQVEKGSWDYLGNSSLLIDKKDNSYLFKHGFFDENILALKVDGKNEYAFLVNENKYEEEINTFKSVTEFLNKKYINSNAQKALEIKYEIEKPEGYKAQQYIPQSINQETEEYHDDNFNTILIGTTILIVFIIFLISMT
ncbi:MAG: hypothetical protein LH606_12945 [Cytophagaceae bacterium]|nr:hypothetical protein [Cytophagaceae bacterium]